MVLAVDIGNSNINIGGFEGRQLLFNARICTDPKRTEFEYAVLIKDILGLYSLDADTIEGAVISSVVPPLSPILRSAVRLVQRVKILLVGPGIKTGLNIRIDDPGQLGADLLATAVGALEQYPLPVIVVDLGTATKLTVVDEHKSFLGGAIMPGVMIALESLSAKTALLSQINLDGGVIQPIGSNTADCMRSGAVLGAACMIDGMVARYRTLLGPDTTVVACGGLVNLIAPHCTCGLTLNETLLLDGLRIIYERNR